MIPREGPFCPADPRSPPSRATGGFFAIAFASARLLRVRALRRRLHPARQVTGAPASTAAPPAEPRCPRRVALRRPGEDVVVRLSRKSRVLVPRRPTSIAIAATSGRVLSKVFIAVMNPRPSPHRSRSDLPPRGGSPPARGTPRTTSSADRSRGAPSCPRAADQNPGVPFSTTNSRCYAARGGIDRRRRRSTTPARRS